PPCTPGQPPNVAGGGPAGPANAPPACNLAQAAAVGTPTLPATTLGVHTVGDVVNFTVPPGTGSMSILSQGSNVPVSTVTNGGNVIPKSGVPPQVTTPSSAMIFDDIPPPAPAGGNDPIFYAGSSPFPAMM